MSSFINKQFWSSHYPAIVANKDFLKTDREMFMMMAPTTDDMNKVRISIAIKDFDGEAKQLTFTMSQEMVATMFYQMNYTLNFCDEFNISEDLLLAAINNSEEWISLPECPSCGGRRFKIL